MRRFFLGNIGMKISAVALAVILWLFVTSKGQSEISIDVPVEIKNVPAGLEAVNHGEKYINIGIKGHERLLRKLKPSSVSVSVDLSKAKKGKGTYYINKEDVILPASTSLTGINPSSISIALEETVMKEVPIKPLITGVPKDGRLVSVEISPKTVKVEGARTEVNKVRSLNTEAVDVSEAEKTFTQDVKIDTSGMNIRTDFQEVNLKIVIKGH